MGPIIPTATGSVMLIDCGATADCTPEFLLQFAFMGSYCARKLLGVERPRVALLNIGTEDSKGGELQKAVYPLLQKAGDAGYIHFIGNIDIKNNIFEGGNEDTFGEKLERKIQEQYLAIQLEKIMDKKIILKNYLNTINLGNNTLGVKAAALRYFDKDVSDLTLSEATVIAGITQNPSRFNPLSENGRKRNEEKRRVILQYMYEQGKITKEEQEEALADDVYSRIKNVDIVTKETQTPYSYFTDELIDQVLKALQDKKGYTETQAYNLLFSGGLEIHTTQDPDIQSVVDEEISRPENYDVVYYSIDYRLSIQHPDQTTTNYSDETLKTYFRKELGETTQNCIGISILEREVANEFPEDYIIQPEDALVCYGLYANFMKFWKSIR